MFYRPRFHYTNSSPKVVGFFLRQYVEVMKNSKDKTDKKLKQYLFKVVTNLGVPNEVVDEIEFEAEPEPEVIVEDTTLPIIHRRKYYAD